MPRTFVDKKKERLCLGLNKRLNCKHAPHHASRLDNNLHLFLAIACCDCFSILLKWSLRAMTLARITWVLLDCIWGHPVQIGKDGGFSGYMAFPFPPHCCWSMSPSLTIEARYRSRDDADKAGKTRTRVSARMLSICSLCEDVGLCFTHGSSPTFADNAPSGL